MRMLGVFICIVALAILCGTAYLPKRWQCVCGWVLFSSMMFIGSCTILESFC